MYRGFANEVRCLASAVKIKHGTISLRTIGTYNMNSSLDKDCLWDPAQAEN